jgi:hypothetical protein
MKTSSLKNIYSNLSNYYTILVNDYGTTKQINDCDRAIVVIGNELDKRGVKDRNLLI